MQVLTVREFLPLHAQHALVPGNRGVEVAAVDDDVIDPVDLESHGGAPSLNDPVPTRVRAVVRIRVARHPPPRNGGRGFGLQGDSTP